MGDAGGIEVADGGEQPAFAIVEGVVVGAGHHVDAEPLDVVEQLRRRGHEGALRDAGRAFIPAPHHRFKVGSSRIAVAEDLGERDELRLIEHAQAPGEHAIARDRDAEMAGFGCVGHR